MMGTQVLRQPLFRTHDSSILELVEARHPLLEENLRASGGSVCQFRFLWMNKTTLW